MAKDLNAQCLERTGQIVDQVFPGSRSMLHPHVLGKSQGLASQAAIEEPHRKMCALDVRCAFAK
jgi:hypothetical protein